MLLCVELFLFAAIAAEDALLDWFTPPPQLHSPPLFSTATFGEALIATDLACAFCEIELLASWLWSAFCVCDPCRLLVRLQQDPLLSSAEAPLCDCSASFWRVLLCCESFLFTAAAPEEALLDWSTEPEFATARFGDALTATDCAFAVWSIEFVAFCDWSIDWLWPAGSSPPGSPPAQAVPTPAASTSARLATSTVNRRFI